MCENTYVNIQNGEVLDLTKINGMKSNAMLRVRPELFVEWNFKKNNEQGLDIYKITKSSVKIAWWICPKCKSNYDMAPDNRTQNKNCPYCASKRINSTNSLAYLKPDIAKQWHSTKNGNLTPHDVTSNNANLFWWFCSDCKSSYEMRISHKKTTSCPYCKGSRSNNTNSLASLNPDIAEQWHHIKNGKLTPHDVTCGSNQKVWWICELGHEWEAVIYGRNKEGYGCPYCSNQKVLKGFNDMWTTNPELASLLANPEDGYKYTQGNSKKKLDWKCPDCGEIIRGKTISNIKMKDLSCGKCSDYISYPEKFIYNLLLQLEIEFEKEEVFTWSQGKRYDFSLDSTCLIEVHGEQHYRYTGRGRTLEEEQKNDILKEKLAKENGIEHYIVIDARESNMNWVKNSIMNSELNKLFNLNNIDWSKIEEDSSHTLVKTACNLWNSNLRNTTLISKKMKLDRHTILRYLKQGEKLGWCDYNADEVMKEVRKHGKKNTKSVVQLTLSDEFIRSWDSMSSAKRETNANHISSCVKGIRNKSGGYRWMYLEDYEKQYGKIEE